MAEHSVDPNPLTQTGECLNHCLLNPTCVALTVDFEMHVCYLFNATTGATMRDGDNWNTLILNQPTQSIQGRWVYSRHSRVLPADDTWDQPKATVEPSLLDCLQSCYFKQEYNKSLLFSFDITRQSSLMFQLKQKIVP
jgi:hypothetical protein